MSEKFTPGPWFVHPHGPRHTVNQQGTNRHVAMVSCYKAANGDDDENIANASLIAAAPEMYALLERVKDELVYHLSFSANAKLAVKAESFGVEIFSLLKKARGEA